eukprot:3899160-Prymnesium_polylepis.1
MSDGGLRFQSRASILYSSIYQSLHCDVGVGPQCTLRGHFAKPESFPTWPIADDVARGGIGSLRAPC